MEVVEGEETTLAGSAVVEVVELSTPSIPVTMEDKPVPEEASTPPEANQCAPKTKARKEAKKINCENCGRSYSQRRVENHVCVPPTFTRGPDPAPVELCAPRDEEPINPVAKEIQSTHPEVDPIRREITPDVITLMIKRDREAKRAAKRERWANQLF